MTVSGSSISGVVGCEGKGEHAQHIETRKHDKWDSSQHIEVPFRKSLPQRSALAALYEREMNKHLWARVGSINSGGLRTSREPDWQYGVYTDMIRSSALCLDKLRFMDMSHNQESILVLAEDIQMMREVLIKAGFDKKTCMDDHENSKRAAALVMISFRNGIIDPDELFGELMFLLGKQSHCRQDPPPRLPKYAIQGLPVERCCSTNCTEQADSEYSDLTKTTTQH